jgi:DNA-binding NarL/FixJ family response regulator
MSLPCVLIINQSLDEFSVGLRTAPLMTVVGEASTAPQALALAAQLQPDVVLFKVEALCAADVQLVARLNQLHPDLKLMLINADPAPNDLLLEAYRQGVGACLLKTQTTLTEIVEAVHARPRGESVLNPQRAGGLLDEIMRAREGGFDHVA